MKLAWAIIVALGVAAAPQRTVFRTATEAVRVDVLVTDGRAPVGGLTVNDFELFDEKVAQRIEDVQIAEVPFSMMLALDTSTSVEGSELRHLKEAAASALGALKSGDRAGVIVFGEVLTRLGTWATPTATLTDRIRSVQAGGATALFDAAFAALFQRDPEAGRRALVILFTDGDDTASWLPEDAALDLANRTDAVVYCVVPSSRERSPGALQFRSGVRLTRQQPIMRSADFVEELARRTGGDLLFTETAGLSRTFERIVSDFRSRYVLSYVPQGVSTTGWHRIEVKLKGRNGKVTARRGYQR